MDRPITMSREQLLALYRCLKGLQGPLRVVEELVERDKLTRMQKFGIGADEYADIIVRK